MNESRDAVLVTQTNNNGSDEIMFGNPYASKVFADNHLVYDQAHKLRNCQILDLRMFKKLDDVPQRNFFENIKGEGSTESLP